MILSCNHVAGLLGTPPCGSHAENCWSSPSWAAAIMGPQNNQDTLGFNVLTPNPTCIPSRSPLSAQRVPSYAQSHLQHKTLILRCNHVAGLFGAPACCSCAPRCTKSLQIPNHTDIPPKSGFQNRYQTGLCWVSGFKRVVPQSLYHI